MLARTLMKHDQYNKQYSRVFSVALLFDVQSISLAGRRHSVVAALLPKKLTVKKTIDAPSVT